MGAVFGYVGIILLFILPVYALRKNLRYKYQLAVASAIVGAYMLYVVISAFV